MTHERDYFDTVAIDAKASGLSSSDFMLAHYHKYDINIRKINDRIVSFSFDEISNLYDLDQLIEIFASMKKMRTSQVEYMPFENYEDRVYWQPRSHIRR